MSEYDYDWTPIAMYFSLCLMMGLAIFSIIVLIDSKRLYDLSQREETMGVSNYLNEENILIGTSSEGLWNKTPYYILIPLSQRPTLTSYAASGSMKPLLDENSNGIEIMPSSEKDINIGDIIGYIYEDNTSTIIVHRIVNTSQDEQGWFATAQGDNNPVPDPQKIRFNQIQGKTIMVIY